MTAGITHIADLQGRKLTAVVRLSNEEIKLSFGKHDIIFRAEADAVVGEAVLKVLGTKKVMVEQDETFMLEEAWEDAADDE